MNLLGAVAVSLGSGIGGAVNASYRDWRTNRAALPADIRNAGFMTDRRARLLHYGIVGAVLSFCLWLATTVLVIAEVLPPWMLPVPHQ